MDNSLQSIGYLDCIDINIELNIKIDQLLVSKALINAKLTSELNEINVDNDFDFCYLSAYTIVHGLKIHSVSIYSCAGRLQSSDGPEADKVYVVEFNDWLKFPLRYKDLESNSVIVFKLYNFDSVLIGITSFSLFKNTIESSYLRQGFLNLFFNKIDKNNPFNEGYFPDCLLDSEEVLSSFILNNFENIAEEETILHENTFKPTSEQEKSEDDWIKVKEKTKEERVKETLSKSVNRFLEKNTFFCLQIQTQDFRVPVMSMSDINQKSKTKSTNEQVKLFPKSTNTEKWGLHFKMIKDPVHFHTDDFSEVDFDENPVEAKDRILSKTQPRSEVDSEARPDKRERILIDNILDKFSCQVQYKFSVEDSDLLWKFQYYLQNKPKCLVPFLSIVNWKKQTELEQAEVLLNNWDNSNIYDAVQVLNCLNNTKVVMTFVLTILSRAKSDQILRFLLQFVQAMRFDIISDDATTETFPEIGMLTSFLVNKSLDNFEVASFLMWHLEVEVSREESFHQGLYKNIQQYFYYTLQTSKNKLSFLDLDIQKSAIKKIMTLFPLLETFKEKAYLREERLKTILQTYPEYVELSNYSYPVPLPLYPKVKFVRIKSITARIIASNSYPMVLDLCLSKDNLMKRVMFKAGDDLRQDQLALQLINLMDRLLKKAGIDLHITTYKVLATEKAEGLVEFVNKSFPISKVLDKHSSILEFFKHYNPIPTSNSDTSISEDSFVTIEGVNQKVLEKFIKSCAGFCVISYILGLGDRHLDNLMLKSSGEMFHIDFGYIFGRDPKAFATEIRLTKEMIITMGGRTSAGYKRFRKYCSQAFEELRRHANLIISIVTLMKNAGIPDLSIHQNFDKTIVALKSKFHLDKENTEASQYILNLIDRNADALAPVIYDMLHKAAVSIK